MTTTGTNQPRQLVLHERVQPDDIFQVLKSKLLDKGQAERLAAYYRIARKHEGRIPVTYTKKESGRYYPDAGYPLYGIYQWRSVRATLYSDYEYDIDAVSCHPTIMCYLAEKFGFKCEVLSAYVKDRPRFIADLDINQTDVDNYNTIEHSDWSLKDMCKFVFTSSMFGSGIKKVVTVLHMQRSPVKDGSISDKLLTQIHTISKELASLECYKHFKVGVSNCHHGKVVSRIISNIESEAVLKLIRTFQDNELDVTIYMYDGFQVRTQADEFIDELLEEFNEQNAYGLTFIRKPFAKKVAEVAETWTGAMARSQDEVDLLLRHIENPEVACVAKMFETKNRIAPAITCIEYAEQYCRPFQEDSQYTCNVIGSDLGSGKTTQVKAFHKKHQPSSAIFLTPRRIFAKSVKASLGDSWTLYLDKTDSRVLSDDFLICQINSLHKVVRSYDHVYVDEIESCLEMLSASILTKKRRDVIENIESMIRNAKRVILCDADISMRTFDFIIGLGVKPENICFEHNTHVGRNREAIQVPNDETLLWHFIDLLKKGKNVVFFSASKSFLINHIVPIIEEMDLSTDEYLIYTPDNNQTITNVEEEWKGKRVVAYTPTITVGVDFNLPDCFDTILVYAQNFGCGPVRQIFQAIHRVRKINMNQIYYSIHPKAEPSHKYPFDNYDDAVEYVDTCAELHDFNETGSQAPVWFKQMHIWNVLEAALSKNKYECVFDYFLQRYGYQKKTTDLKDLSKDTGPESTDSGIVDFDDIMDIDYDEFLEHDKLLHKGELDPKQYQQYYKWRFQFEHPLVSTEFFPMMLNSRGRHILKRLNWEISKSDSVDLLRKQLGNDYLETVSYDSIILDKMNQMSTCLGIEYSADPKEIPLSRFSKPEVLACLSDVSRLLTLGKAKKDVSKVASLFKFWNGCSIEPVKSEGGKGIKRMTVGGKREKLYQVVGLEGFKR